MNIEQELERQKQRDADERKKALEKAAVKARLDKEEAMLKLWRAKNRGKK